MADETKTIQIIISAQDKATQAIKGTSKSLQESKESSKGLKQEFHDLSKGIMTGVGLITGEIVILKKAFRFGEQGAEVIQLRESFEMLMDTVGANSDQLEQLRRASKGTISTMQLMSATSTLLAGAQGDLVKALSDATPQLLEIAKAANKLNPTLGDTAFLYQSIATGIKRASPMILDNLGLTIKIGEANEEYAKTLGKSAEALTVEEQKMALLNETLRAGNILIAQVGGNTDSAVDPFKRLTVAAEELGDTLKEKTAPFLTQAAEALELLLTWKQKLDAAAAEHTNWALDEAETYDEYVAAIRRVLAVTDKGTADVIDMMEANNSLAFAMQNMVDAGLVLDKETWQWRRGLMELTEASIGAERAYGRLGDTMETEAQKAARVAREINQVERAMGDLASTVGGAVGKEMERYADTTTDLRDRSKELNEKIRELEDRRYLTAEQKEDLDELKTDLAEVATETERAAEAHREAMKRMVYDMTIAKLSADGFTAAEFTLATDIAKSMGLIDDSTARMVDGVNATLAQFDKDGNLEAASASIDGLVGRMLTVEEKTSGMVSPADAAMMAWKADYDSMEEDVVAVGTALDELPEETEVKITILDQDPLMEWMTTYVRLIREAEGKHNVIFDMQGGGGLPTAPSAPSGMTAPQPAGPGVGTSRGTGETITTVRGGEPQEQVAGGGPINNFNLTVNTSRQLFSVRHEFEVMSALGGQ